MTNIKVRGFTLLETMIVVSIFSIVSFIALTFITQSYRANRFTNQQNSAINEAKRGINTMIPEIRESTSGDNGDYPIQETQRQVFTFYGDVDLDEVVEKITYLLNGTLLEKGVTEPTGNPPIYNPLNTSTTTISKYIRNTSTEAIFTYYNGDWPGDIVNNPLSYPADPDEVKLIHVFLRVNTNTVTSSKDFLLETNVQLRSLKDNL